MGQGYLAVDTGKLRSPRGRESMNKYTEAEVNSVEQYLVMKTESDADFDLLFHEWEVVKSIVENNHAQEWLDGLVEQFLDGAKEWEEDSK